jgi:hypothetical protein
VAVDSLELKPRASVALLDAAVRLCGRALGVWSIVLPAGAALTWAVFDFVEAVRLHHSTLGPATALAAAWLFRGISQGAASHHLEQTVLGTGEPDAWKSWRAALYRFPSLCVVTAHNLVLNIFITLFTLGLGPLFLSAHMAGYAVALRGEGHPLATYITCARLLGPAKATAGWLKVAGFTQLIIALNLQLAVTLGLKALTTLVAIDVTFIDRFTSVDNPVWIATLLALTFTLFEPLRAACATLLLVDGRVRQEGLDLVAAVEQLPHRRGARASTAFGAALLLCLAAPAVHAEEDDWKGTYFPGVSGPVQDVEGSSLTERLEGVLDDCEEKDAAVRAQVARLSTLPQSERAALTRFVSRIDAFAFDDEDCETALRELKAGLDLALTAQPEGDSAQARDEAKAILACPEFELPLSQAQKEKPEGEPDAPTEPPGWFAKAWDDFWKWVAKLFKPERRAAPIERAAPTFDLGLTNAVVIVAVLLVLAFLVTLLLRATGKKGDEEVEAHVSGLNEMPLTEDPMSALARAPEGWAELADQLAREGQFREAIRHLYLALLSRLHRDGAIDYDPAKSNWDYFRGFRGPRESLGPFKELTLRFDFAWYGHIDVTPNAYTAFRSLTQPLLAREEAANA